MTGYWILAVDYSVRVRVKGLCRPCRGLLVFLRFVAPSTPVLG